MSKGNNFGCVLICVFVLCLFSFIRSLFYDLFYPEIEIDKKKEFVKEWKQSNINFFHNLNCPNFSDDQKNIKIKKFYIFLTSREVDCGKINKMFDSYSNSRYGLHKLNLKFSNSKYNDFETPYIDSSDVYIWVKTIPGEIEGHYSGGSRAIRENNEINFIETKTNRILKKIIIKGVGEPLDQVREGYTEKSKDYFFGIYSIDEISRIVEMNLDKGLYN